MKKIRSLTLISIILLCIGLTTKTMQNDTFYTIKIGESILKNGIDFLDHFSWLNLPYSYPHWLYDILIYLIYDNYSFKGLYILSIILYIAIAISEYYVILRKTKNDFVASFFSIISLVSIRGFITTRAQTLSILLFIWEVYFLENYTRTGKKRDLIVLTIISVLIANIHAATWPMVLILILPYLAEELIIKIKNKKKIPKNIKVGFNTSLKKIKLCQNNKSLIPLIIVSILSGLVTPIKDMPYTYTLKIMMGNSQQYITEHNPLNITMTPPLVIVLIILIISIIGFTKIKIRLKDLLMITGLTFMSALSVRHLLFFLTIGLIFISNLINDFFLEEDDPTPKQLISLINNKLVFLIILTFILIKSTNLYLKNSTKEYIDSNIYPVKVSNYILENLNLDKLRIYNEVNYGSYLIYRNIPVYVDSRSDLYLKEFNNQDISIYEESINIINNYEEVFEKYQMTHVLLSNNNILNKILEKEDKYKVEYSDDNFTLYSIDL